MPLIIIGLGNPGGKYRNNRHNVGFHVVDGLASRFGISFKKVFFRPYLLGARDIEGGRLYLVKPLTYMNRSGSILSHVLKRCSCSLEDIVVVCDNLDISPGKGRLKRKGSSGGQRGLQSLIDYAGTNEFMRFFVGIGRPPRGGDVITHVLGDPDSREQKLLNKVIKQGIDCLPLFLKEEEARVISLING